MYGKLGRKPPTTGTDPFDELLLEADTRTEYLASVLRRPTARKVHRTVLGVEDIVDDYALVASPSPVKKRPLLSLSSGRLPRPLDLDNTTLSSSSQFFSPISRQSHSVPPHVTKNTLASPACSKEYCTPPKKSVQLLKEHKSIPRMDTISEISVPSAKRLKSNGASQESSPCPSFQGILPNSAKSFEPQSIAKTKTSKPVAKTLTHHRVKNLAFRTNSVLLVELLLGIKSAPLQRLRKQLLSPSVSLLSNFNKHNSNTSNKNNENKRNNDNHNSPKHNLESQRHKIAWKIKPIPPLSEERTLIDPPPLCLVQHLLREGADPNYRDADGYSALYLSLRFKGAEVFNEVLQAGGDAMGVGRLPGDPCRYRSLVDYCLLLGQAACIPPLMQKGSLPSAVGSVGLPRLYTLAKAFDFLHVCDGYLHSALLACLSSGADASRVQALVQHHSNPKALLRAKNKHGLCAVALCLKSPLNPELLQVLLEAGGDPHALDQHETPVAVPLLLRHGTAPLRCLELLSKHGLNPQLAVEPGVSLLQFAREHAVRAETVALLENPRNECHF